MGHNRVKNRFELALDAKQAVALVVGVTVLVGGVFVLGMNLGRRSMIAVAPIAAPKDPLARLDEPLPVPAPVPEETVELKAHQALTDARPIDKALPVPQVKVATVAITPPAASVHHDYPDRMSALPDREGSVRPERSARGAESKGGGAKSKGVLPESKAASAKSKGAGAERKGAYTIQIASLQNRSDAEKVAKKNGARNPRIVAADVPGKGRCYRVVVGSFPSQDAAKRQLATLTRAGVQGIVTAVR
jgi:septal ring-binding cell division protein DamX